MSKSLTSLYLQFIKIKEKYLILVEDDVHFANWAEAELRRQMVDMTVIVFYDLKSAQHWLAGPEALHLGMAVVDLHLGQEKGVALIEQLHQSHAEVPLLVLTSVDVPQEALAAIRAGAQGYLLKSTVSDELAHAVQQLRAGGSPINPQHRFSIAGGVS